ncbi:uncharacterized protein LOC135365891 isoform X2 [Ornithodoros turicata]|uniref:uncharacterized protein LOC135365891 isoform X2 n=1 Tax=Ornithodoros turicata TaxID=34597 RepID=UPI0031391F73
MEQPLIPAGELPEQQQGAVPPEEPLDPMLVQMQMEEQLFMLLNQPIIPDILAFTCGCLYLIVAYAMMGGLSIYLYYKLAPPTIPPAAAETEVNIEFITTPKANVTVKPLWDQASEDNPVICLVDANMALQIDMPYYLTLCIHTVLTNPLKIQFKPSVKWDTTDVTKQRYGEILTVCKQQCMLNLNWGYFFMNQKNKKLTPKWTSFKLGNNGFYYDVDIQHTKTPGWEKHLKEFTNGVGRKKTTIILNVDIQLITTFAKIIQEPKMQFVRYLIINKLQSRSPARALLPNPWLPYMTGNEPDLNSTSETVAEQQRSVSSPNSPYKQRLCILLTAATYKAVGTGSGPVDPGASTTSLDIEPFTAVINMLLVGNVTCFAVAEAAHDDRQTTCTGKQLPLIRAIRNTIDSQPLDHTPVTP